MDSGTYMTPLVEVLSDLRKKGYNCDFLLRNKKLSCNRCGKEFRSDEIIIERVYRFEGNSNPDDMAVMYGVKSIDGTKGVLIDAYGTYDDEDLGEFLKNVKLI